MRREGEMMRREGEMMRREGEMMRREGEMMRKEGEMMRGGRKGEMIIGGSERGKWYSGPSLILISLM